MRFSDGTFGFAASTRRVRNVNLQFNTPFLIRLDPFTSRTNQAFSCDSMINIPNSNAYEKISGNSFEDARDSLN